MPLACGAPRVTLPRRRILTTELDPGVQFSVTAQKIPVARLVDYVEAARS